MHQVCIQALQTHDQHLYTSNAPSLQAPTYAPNVLQCTSDTKHPTVPPSTQTSQNPLPKQQAIKSLIVELV